MKTLAIDASTKSSGIAIFQQGKLIHYQCFTSDLKNVFQRIEYMTNQIVRTCLKYKPTDIVMEDVIPQDVGDNQNIYKKLMYLQGDIIKALNKYNYTVYFYVASHWRKLCGIKVGPQRFRENLKKDSIKLVKQIYNIDVNDDISDAICLGIAYIKQHKSR